MRFAISKATKVLATLPLYCCGTKSEALRAFAWRWANSKLLSGAGFVSVISVLIVDQIGFVNLLNGLYSIQIERYVLFQRIL